jgi:hypothetical protein
LSPADLLEQPFPFRFHDPKTKGTLELKIAARPLEVEFAFERWLQGLALQNVAAQEKNVAPHHFLLLMDGWRRDGPAGVFEWDSYAAQMARLSRRGKEELAFLDLNCHNPQVTRELVHRILADPAKAAELEALIERANHVPGADSPNGAGPGPGGSSTSGDSADASPASPGGS